MFGSKKSSGEDGAHDDDDAAEIRAAQAEARAELAERRVRDADDIAAQRVTAASQSLMEVREVVAVLHERLDAATGELAAIATRFEQNVVEKPEVDTAKEAETDGGERRKAADPAQKKRKAPAGGAQDALRGSEQPHAGTSPLERATRMAMAGNSRERIARTLSEEFGVDDPTPILDEAIGHEED